MISDYLDEVSLANTAKAIQRADAVFIATGMLQTATTRPEKSFKEITREHLVESLLINTVAPTLALKHLTPLLPRSGRSVVATVSARVASMGDNALGGWTSYRCSKAGVNMVVKNLAIEMARTHPQAMVVTLHPGLVTSKLSDGLASGKQPKSADQAATELIGLLEGLNDPKTQSGGFFQYDGLRLPY